MPTRTPDHFTPAGDLPPEVLRAYAEGRLDADAAHAVELHLLADPLLDEAAEGLQEAGALEGLDALAQARPRPAPGGAGWIVGAIALLIPAAFFWYTVGTTEPSPSVRTTPTGIPAPSGPIRGADAPEPLDAAEIAAAVELPESLSIGHDGDERHAVAMRTEIGSMERTAVERMPSRPVTIAPVADSTDARPARAEKPSLQLVYLYDLKLVHPRELYPYEAFVDQPIEGLPANYADRQQRTSALAETRKVAYLRFMDEAMAHFARNDHKACLDDLRFVLAQYPDDVNALFYAGLCCYNLGLNERARTFLHRAATHPIPVFDEEAVWYHALALDRSGESAAAQEAYQRIVAQGGFYAERARLKMVAGTN